MPVPIRFYSDTAHGEHPGLADRKVLTTRIIASYVRAHVERGDPVGQESDDLQLRVEYLTRASTPKRHATTLSQFLADLVADLRRTNAETSATSSIERFAAEAALIDCTNCAARSSSGMPCRNRLRDSENLEGVGQCWSLLTELFTCLVELAEEAYGGLLNEHEVRTLHLRLQTRRTTEADLGARTQFLRETGSNRRAIIELKLPIERFDDSHLTRLPYILFHEICVHGPEAWLGGSRHEPGPERTTELCAFREGFVDAAAAWLLRYWLVTAPERLARHATLADKYDMATTAAQYGRASAGPAEFLASGESARARRGITNVRARGLSLFNRMLQLDTIGGTVPGEAVAHLAFALNLLPLSENQRTRLVNALQAAAEPHAITLRREWLKRLREATSAHDLRRLQAEIAPHVAEENFGD